MSERPDFRPGDLIETKRGLRRRVHKVKRGVMTGGNGNREGQFRWYVTIKHLHMTSHVLADECELIERGDTKKYSREVNSERQNAKETET
jgi:hypothetical protein